MIRKICIMLCALGTLTACATEEGYRQKVNLMIGKTAADVEAEWGLPYGKADLTDGGELWAYRRGYVSRADEQWGTDETSDKQKWKDDKGVEHVRRTSTSRTTYEPPSATWHYCETRFVFGADQHVRDVRFNGNDCLAEEKGTPSRTLLGGTTESSQ